jgi:hypothetical protein
LVSVERRDSGEAAAAAAPAEARRVGEFTALLTAGYVAFPSGGAFPAEQGPGAGGSIGIVFRLGPVAFGPELGMMAAAPGRLTTFAGIGRVNLGHPGSADRVTYLVAGAGVHAWTDRDAVFTGTLGVGVTRGGRWRIEARWNPSLQYADPANPRPTLLTLGVGRGLSW